MPSLSRAASTPAAREQPGTLEEGSRRVVEVDVTVATVHVHVTRVVSLVYINASCQIQSIALDLARQAIPRGYVYRYMLGGVVRRPRTLVQSIAHAGWEFSVLLSAVRTMSSRAA